MPNKCLKLFTVKIKLKTYFHNGKISEKPSHSRILFATCKLLLREKTR